MLRRLTRLRSASRALSAGRAGPLCKRNSAIGPPGVPDPFGLCGGSVAHYCGRHCGAERGCTYSIIYLDAAQAGCRRRPAEGILGLIFCTFSFSVSQCHRLAKRTYLGLRVSWVWAEIERLQRCLNEGSSQTSLPIGPFHFKSYIQPAPLLRACEQFNQDRRRGHAWRTVAYRGCGEIDNRGREIYR